MSRPMKYTNEGVPKNWNGKDWQTYKWAMMNVFKENDLKDIAVGDLTKAMLSTASAEVNKAFEKKQLKIMRMIGTSVPPGVLQQIRDKETGSEMWTELCNLYEGKQSEAIKAYTIRRLENELWTMKLAPGGDANLHLCKMFNVKTELGDLNHTVADNTTVDMMLQSLPDQIEFERLKSSIWYGADPSVYTPKRVRELILAATARQKEFRGKRNEKHGGPRGGSNKGNGQEKGGGQSNRETGGSKKTRKCFVCGSEDHLRVNCPDRAKKQDGADETEQKRKPRGNCTLRQERSPTLSISPPSTPIEDVDRGVVAGVSAVEAGEPQRQPQGEPVAEEAADGSAEGGHAEPERTGESQMEVHDQVTADLGGGWWYFDTASNSHVTGNFDDFVSFTADRSSVQSIRGVSPNIASQIAGVGTVAIVTEVDGQNVVTFVDDVFYIPGAEYGLFSPGLAHEQGFHFDFDSATRNFIISIEGRTVAVATPQDATWGFQVGGQVRRARLIPGESALCNYTMADGVRSLTLWHERLCHTCPQYLKTMVDKGLVRGMMLTQRQQDTCDACHLGKQKKKALRKKLDRSLKFPNQVVYADLLFPEKANHTKYAAVLVILDGYSRYVTLHLLKDKDSKVVNKHMKEYVLWAERQARRKANGTSFKVQQIWSDQGGEFFNDEIDEWYRTQGIVHEKLARKSSQLNLCERTHQSLEGMAKASMADAGFPRSLWLEAIRNAVYVKNRVYNKGTQGVPYEMMFGTKPDVHHIRKCGALAYVHVPVSPGRKKFDANAKIGFVLGYAEDVIGCKVYFPEEHTAKFVSDLRIAEEVVYRDRHEVGVDDDDLSSLHFTHRDSEDQDEDSDGSQTDTDVEMNEPSEASSRGLGRGESGEFTATHFAEP